MADGWYTDSPAGIGAKEAYGGIQGCWLVEPGELAAIRKTEVETIKNFISKQVDSCRTGWRSRGGSGAANTASKPGLDASLNARWSSGTRGETSA